MAIDKSEGTWRERGGTRTTENRETVMDSELRAGSSSVDFNRTQEETVVF